MSRPQCYAIGQHENKIALVYGDFWDANAGDHYDRQGHNEDWTVVKTFTPTQQLLLASLLRLHGHGCLMELFETTVLIPATA